MTDEWKEDRRHDTKLAPPLHLKGQNVTDEAEYYHSVAKEDAMSWKENENESPGTDGEMDGGQNWDLAMKRRRGGETTVKSRYLVERINQVGNVFADTLKLLGRGEN